MSNSNWRTQFEQRLEQQRSTHRWRNQSLLQSAQGPNVYSENKALVNFSSNDYLSLAADPKLKQALAEGAEQFGLGSGASHLICGHFEAHKQLETSLAEWLGFEAVTLFSSGYMANMALLKTLFGKNDLIVQDKLNHASLIDAAIASTAVHRRYQHGNIDSMQQQLAGDFSVKAVVTDGVFSMDGDSAPLSTILESIENNNTLLIVDDAHGLGVMGKSGRGSLEGQAIKLQDHIVVMGTLGKAFGGSGAFVASNNTVAGLLHQFGRSYIYTTAMSPAVAWANKSAIELVKNDQSLITQLQNNIAYFKSLIKQTNVQILESNSAIQPIVIGDDKTVINIAAELYEHGFWVGAIRPPTVPTGTARLRITINRGHTKGDINALVKALENAIDKFS